jgi:hypothetical protein
MKRTSGRTFSFKNVLYDIPGRDVLMTSVAEEGETGSGKERFPVPDLNVRKGLTTMDPDQETVEFLPLKITK